MPTLTVNGIKLYHEVRGEGPPVLLIMGATGDGGHFERLAELLADEFTVVAYDRRGNGRSPRPAGWATTTPDEQADDAAALLEALGLAPAAVFGTSSGANFALALAIRRPAVVRCALLHEPVMVSLTDDPAAVRVATATLLGEAMKSGGPPAAVERFWRMVAGETGWEELEPSLRERMLASADTFLGVEAGTFEGFLPDDETLASIPAPVQVLISDDGRKPWHQAAGRLAERLHVEVIRTPGTHTPYHDHPQELAQTMRPFLHRVSPRQVLSETDLP
jgi:pimeloyl-ACP methyl ester carboxylesterase